MSRRLKIGLAIVIAGFGEALAQAPEGPLNLPPLPDLGVPAFVRPLTAALRCDRAAATVADPGQAEAGVARAQIDTAAALEACAAAARENDDPRYLYQLARAQRAAGDGTAARRALAAAAARGHAMAMVDLSWMLQRGEGGAPDLAAAFQMAVRAADTGDGEGLYRLAGFHRHPIVGRLDLERWRTLLEAAMAAGSVDAARDLATAFERGEGVRRNPDIAADLHLTVVELATPRADRFDSAALVAMAAATEAGVGGVARDRVAAVARYREAETRGDDGRASYALGRLTSEGHGIARDRTRACDHFERGAGLYDLASMTALATCYLRGDGRPQDQARALQLYRQAIAAGDDLAPLLLGRLLHADASQQQAGEATNGEARELLRLAAERGNADGMIEYAAHLRDDGVARAREACDWLEQAAGLGVARAMTAYGVCFAADTGGRDKDLAVALEWYRQGAERGDGPALRLVGEAYRNGEGTSADIVQALAYFRRSAETGDATAMNEVGMMLTNGTAVAADVRAGCDWFEKAAAAGSTRGMNNLGACYVNGEGREVDIGLGRSWYEKAVAAGDMVAMANLGELYASGRSVVRSPERAFELYRRSADLGHIPAAVELAAAYFNGIGVVRDTRAACTWYERAAAANNAAGLNGLGVCTENGIGRRRDGKAALALFAQAANAGSVTALRNLVRVNDRATGNERNPDAAADWLRKAIDRGYDGLVNDFLSYPSSWSRDMRRALQRSLKRDGLYDGSTDGLLTSALDRVIWSKVAPANGRERLTQDFTFAPIDGAPRGLLVRVCKPAGATGKRPLVVINHGLTTDDGERRDMRPLSCGAIASFFTQRGYIVAVPLRRGYGETGGRFDEGGTRICATSPNFIEPGLTIAADIQATIQHMTRRPDVAADGTIVLGHSGGGWGALALASKNAPGLAGYVNISGVHGSNRNTPDGVCGPDPIIKSTREFGRKARTPTLWIYAENDSHAGPRLVRRMFDTFTREGGNAILHVLPAYDGDGHNIFDDDSFDSWSGIVDDWLRTLRGGGTAKP